MGRKTKDEANLAREPRWKLPAPPKGLEDLVRDWEWTWTKAVAFCLGLGFVILITQAVIPSFLFYYLDTTGCWLPGSADGIACKALFWDDHSMNQYMAEAIIMGWITVSFAALLVVPVILQNWRRKLRGHDHIRSGYRKGSEA